MFGLVWFLFWKGPLNTNGDLGGGQWLSCLVLYLKVVGVLFTLPRRTVLTIDPGISVIHFPHRHVVKDALCLIQIVATSGENGKHLFRKPLLYPDLCGRKYLNQDSILHNFDFQITHIFKHMHKCLFVMG